MTTSEQWHKARLRLQGFMAQNKHLLPADLIQAARMLYGPHDRARAKLPGESEAQYRTHLHETRPMLARHLIPPWSTRAAWYIELVNLFIADCERWIERAERPEKLAA